MVEAAKGVERVKRVVADTVEEGERERRRRGAAVHGGPWRRAGGGGTRRSLERSATMGRPQRWWQRRASRRNHTSGREAVEVEGNNGEVMERDGEEGS